MTIQKPQDDDEYPEFKMPIMKASELHRAVYQAQIEEDLYKQHQRNKELFDKKKADMTNQKILVSLEFERLSAPVVRTDVETYVFRSMRSGIPFNIISYCLSKHPNEVIKIGILKSELKANGIDANGITNIKENIRKSWFGEKQALSVFIEVSPQAIMMKPSASISKEQLQKIIETVKIT